MLDDASPVVRPRLSEIVLLNGQSVSPAATSNARWKIPFIHETIVAGSCPPPFIAITESWLKGYITDAQIEIAGYQALRSDRPDRVGGGCILYVHNDLVVTDWDHHEDRCNNLVTCYSKSCNTMIALVYRPPGRETQGYKHLLQRLQDKIDGLSGNTSVPDLYIMGDFNYPDINWSKGLQQDSQAAEMREFINRNFLTQVVNQPTRGNNTLDLVLTNVPRYVVEVRVAPTTLSDHDLVRVLLGHNFLNRKKIEPPIVDPLSFRGVDYHRADTEEMKKSFEKIDWVLLWEECNRDLNEFLELFNRTVLRITLMHSPAKESLQVINTRKKKKNKKVYVMKRQRRKLNARISALKNANSPSQVIKLNKLTQEVNLISYEIQEEILSRLNKKEERAVKCIKENPKYFFSYAKRLQKTRSTIPVLRDETGELVEDPATKADVLQRQYVKVFSDPDQADIGKCLDGDGMPQGRSRGFSEFSFTEEDIVDALKELDPYSAAPDGDIPARILTSFKEQLAEPLCLFWSESLSSGCIPDPLKIQQITPIYKKGDRTDPANYRPVSLTSHVMKTFERVFRKNLVSYLEANELLSENQHGFRKKRSCMTQLLSHVEKIYESLNKDEEVDVIYLDFAKAFDKVDHQVLLAKLERYGIGGQALGWLREFLLNRKQAVVVEGQRSSLQTVLSGVPQGTVLGPVLFVLYINDLLDSIKSNNGLGFADDTKLIGAIKDALGSAALQEELNQVIKWAENNNMQLHEQKFDVLSYSLNKTKEHREMIKLFPLYAETVVYTTPKGHVITPKETVRDLGVHVSSSRSWGPHIEKTVQSARKMAAWTLSAFRDRSATVMLTLYKSMVRSKLEYCCPVWNPTKIGEIQKLEDVQRAFTRRVSGCRDLMYWDRLKWLKIMSLQRRRERYCIIHVWKILNGHAPNDVGMQFETRERHGIKAMIPPTSKVAQLSVRSDYDRSFKIRAAQLWNLLPAVTGKLGNLDSFKIGLCRFLEQYPDTPPVTGYTPANDNSLLSWRWTSMRPLT